ncbi:MAG: dicarboxylate/amino acid:cation symporter [Oligosphaeraceae bacterium]
MTLSPSKGFNGKQMLIWVAALALGGILGALNVSWITAVCDIVAAIFTRLFKLLAVPTIALAVTTTLATLGAHRKTTKIFLRTLAYTLLTTFASALVGLLLFRLVAPGNLEESAILEGTSNVSLQLQNLHYSDHLLSVVPDNFVGSLLNGNVLSVILLAAAVGLTLAIRRESPQVQALTQVILGMQDVLFTLIRGLVWILPLGIVAFASQFAGQFGTWVSGALGKYVLVVLAGNLIQFFLVLPCFLLLHRLNPLSVFRAMLPAVLMAFFTKSSAATLPVTVASAENNLKARPEVARFILPLCCTINMNGCAAFILVTSLFVMQNSGIVLTAPLMALWVVISVFSAVGNAGVPMGCYFLTLALMAGLGAPLGIMGLILPIFSVIDMVETGENVWSDCCICAIVDKAVGKETEA